jgi:hypothetical protein
MSHRPHGHYFKNTSHLQSIDVYRVLELFDVTNPSIAHAVKKLLVAGGRGAGKDQNRDVQEAIDSLARFIEMREEDRAHVFNNIKDIECNPVDTPSLKSVPIPPSVSSEAGLSPNSLSAGSISR